MHKKFLEELLDAMIKFVYIEDVEKEKEVDKKEEKQEIEQ